MKTVAGFLIGASFTVGFSSCQKEIDWSTPNQVTSDSIYITKAVGLDTTLPAGTDTTTWLYFTYDNSKRLTQLVGVTKRPALAADTVIHTYYYQGSETLPYKYIIDDLDYSGPSPWFSQTIVHNFYSNGIISKDSVIELDITGGSNDGATVSTFAVSGSTVSRYRNMYDFISGNYILSGKDTTVYTVSQIGGNIVTQTVTSGIGAYQQAQVSYDNKKNPLSKVIKIKYPVFESPYFELWNFQFNNVLHAQFQEYQNPTYNEWYTYQYRPDNYPSSSTYDDDYGSNFYNKVFYFYITL
ncbi:MAG TPA: hypothetical protein VK483_04545 [Chitinophagaceae bacterium]|nr:hypothetical protein [Chitinophagaceae bacterium]